jgi:nodulation protein E
LIDERDSHGDGRGHRVVITGYGCVSAFGVGVGRLWRALEAGETGFRAVVPEFAADGLERLVAAAPFRGQDHFTEAELRLLDRNVQMALVACREAVAQAGHPFADGGGRNAAVIVGTSIGGMSTLEENYHRLYGLKKDRLHPFTIPRLINNAAASHIAIAFGITGPVMSVSTSCSSSNHAIGEAFAMVRAGRADAALAGGTEACITWGCLKAWEALRVLSREVPRPFSAGRQGMVLGEGSGILVLERRDRALARGATILAEIIGYGTSADAHDMVAPSEDGAALAMSRALDDAGIAPAACGYVSAHGSGTAANDAMETRAIKRVFGAHAARLPISSTKSMHGHALGASGALELIATAEAMRRQIIPPTANYLGRDPECDLDYVPNEARRHAAQIALSNSFAFGGLNAVLCLQLP